MADLEPLDLDAIANEGTPFPFLFDGERYELPASPSVDAIELLSEGRLTDAIYELLGDEQFTRIDESDKVLHVGQVEKLLDAYMAHAGLGDLGKQQASGRSSKKKRRR